MNDIDVKVVENNDEENKEVKQPVEYAMIFMNEEEMKEEVKKDEEFFKALRFATSEFYRKIREVYEVEGIAGLKRLERSLDTYMHIRGMVMNEVIESNPNVVAHEHGDDENEEKIVFED